MKILYCYQYGILGGVCTQLLHRLDQFRRGDAVEAHIAFAKDYGISQTLTDYPWLHICDPARITKLIKQYDFDVVVVIDSPHFLKALEDANDSTPRLIEVHTTTERGLMYLDQRRWPAQGYIVPSIYSAGLLTEKFGIDSNKIRVTPNALQESLFQFDKSLPKPQKPIIAWVGKLDEHKNYHGFLDIAEQLIECEIKADFWMVGGQTAPDEIVQNLIDEMECRSLHAHCRWFDRVEHHAMSRFYSLVRKSGGCLLSTSINESFGMSVLEAMLTGCPVVSADVGAIGELAPNKPYLKRFPLHDVQGACDHLEIVRNREHYTQMVRTLDQDRADLVRQCDPKTVAQQYLHVIHELTGVAGGEFSTAPAYAA